MPKRTASEAFTEPQRSRSLSPPRKTSTRGLPTPPYSPESPFRSARAKLNSNNALLDLTSAPAEDDVVNEADDPLLYRILTGLEYTRAQLAQGKRIMQTARFALNEREQRYPGSALEALRRAGRAGHATRIAMGFFEGDIHELWEIGVPRPDWVKQGILGGVHDPQWWSGVEAAMVKAGPWATDEGVRRARAVLKGKDTRKRNQVKKSKKEEGIDWKLKEGMRRQERGEQMWDSEGSGSEDLISSSEESDSSTTDSEDSDDGPLMLRLGRWKAAQRSRLPLDSSTASSNRHSVSPDDSDTYEPSSSGTDYSDDEPLERSHQAKRRSRSHDTDDSDVEPLMRKSRRKAVQRKRLIAVEAANTSKNGQNETDSESDEEPRVPVFSKWKAAQQKRPITVKASNTSRNRQNETDSESDEEDPRVPVFSKWKAAQRQRTAGSMTISKHREDDNAPSSDEECDSTPPWRPMLRRQSDGQMQRRRPVILENSDTEDGQVA